MAAWLGFHDRYQLARSLRRDGLPPLEVLSGWARTLYWILEAETSGISLRELAERERLDPAVAYRLVRRVTGSRWSEVRRDGLASALLRFKDRCGHTAPAQNTHVVAVAGNRVAPQRLIRRSHTASIDTRDRSVAMSNTPPHAVPQPVSGFVRERVYMTGMPYDVAFTSAGHALVTRPHAAMVDVVALDPLRVIRSIHVGAAPTRVVPARRGPLAYVTTQFAESVDIIDTGRGQQIAAIPMPGHALGAALAPDGRTLYVVTNQDRLLAIAVARRTVAATTPIPLACPHLAVHPSGRWIYVPCWRAAVVLEVDAHTLNVARRFEVGGAVQDVLVSSDGQTLYIANERGSLDAIHLATARRSVVQLGTGALGLALSRDSAALFASLFMAGRVVVLRRVALCESAVIATGGRPQRFGVHTDGTVLVANDAGWVDSICVAERQNI
ncbi:MAG TPA: hypothetical protein VGU74_07760 [Gemmatimonadales bacterium]|nr:hypothetical protein [Gemmatimonadales bacterium]